MTAFDQLDEYLRRLTVRLRLGALVRGTAVTALVALAATVLLAVVTSRFAFSERSLTNGRLALFFSLAFTLGFGVVVPLLRLSRGKVALSAEKKFPEFQQRLLTFGEAEGSSEENPFLELLAADTAEVARLAQPRRLVTDRLLIALLSTGSAAVAVLVWLTVAGPGFLGHGASLLWGAIPRGGERPFYDIVVTPGSRTVRRGASQQVAARVVGFEAQALRLFARYRGASKWEEAMMMPAEGTTGYVFVFAAIPETVDYYVDAGRLRSKAYTISVIDMPAVQRIRVTYKFPSWTGMSELVEDPGGDLRAVEGTEADVAVATDRPLESGVLVLDGIGEVSLGGSGKWRSGRVPIRKDGFYYVAIRHEGEVVRLSDDYFIEARKDEKPTLRIARPGRDARVSPIEEVTVAVEAEDDFGLRDLALHYSVNGGPEQTAPLLEKKAARSASGTTTLYLEDFKLAPGDIVSMYATARDAVSTARSDIAFIEAQPFEREYSQSQQSGGGEGGGMGGEQNRISQRQKEIIAATWNQLRDSAQNKQKATENGKFLAGIQRKLRDQARSLATRMGRRELPAQNEEFKSFAENMQQAAEAMGTAMEKLQTRRWRDALSPEQTALQRLLRAETIFHQIQVAFGNRGGGGGGGGMGRDLENLFDLELDTEKTQYETGQRQASAGQQGREMDEAMHRLEELARRQRELADQSWRQQAPQQRWQQEMLRREAEELQRRLEEMVRGEGQSSAGHAGAHSALRRLREATEDMRRSGGGGAEARRAAERLQQARDVMRGMQRQESTERLDDLTRQAEQLAEGQREQASRVDQLFPGPSESDAGQASRQGVTKEQLQQSRRLAEEKRRMGEELARLEREMQQTARDLAGEQPAASFRLRQALGTLQQEELALRLRYNSELLRQGLGQYARPREAPITSALDRMRDQVREARKALGGSTRGDVDAAQALGRIEDMRRGLERLGRQRGEREDVGRLYSESIRNLRQLERSLGADPGGIFAGTGPLIGEWQRLNLGRYPGNPELLEQLRTRVLTELDEIELQLRRKLDSEQGSKARTAGSESVPEGYADAVAEYFRRLSRQK